MSSANSGEPAGNIAVPTRAAIDEIPGSKAPDEKKVATRIQSVQELFMATGAAGQSDENEYIRRRRVWFDRNTGADERDWLEWLEVSTPLTGYILDWHGWKRGATEMDYLKMHRARTVACAETAFPVQHKTNESAAVESPDDMPLLEGETDDMLPLEDE